MKNRRSAPRYRSREVALQVLYAFDASRGARSTDPGPPSLEETFEAVAENFDLPAGARDFAEDLARGVVSEQAPLDLLIESHALNWRLSRMAAVDRNILRLAVFELLHSETPTSIVLDEAIELAHRFGSDSSPSFVNGVLDAVARATVSSQRPQAGSA